MIDPMVPLPYHVLGVRPETRDTSTLTLEPVRDASAAFEPGQFNMVYVFGVGEVPISISGDPGHPNPLVHTVRAVGAVTAAVCKAKRGDVLGIRGPFGSHWPVEEAVGKDVVILAGGIGLAPLRPALLAILAHRDLYGRVVLLYGARAPQELLYARQLNQWRGRFDLDVEVTVDTATREWRGNVGVVTTLIPRAPFDSEEVVALVCGPEVMMRFTLSGLQDRGVPPENIYISMERNMKCAVGFCGHCQYGPTFICKDGPVFRYDRVASLLKVREV
jgi:NAD(P)H-flavin reductase